MKEPSIAGAPDEDHFAYLFSGYIDVPEEGIWSFALKSDDGSALWIDGVCVVNNDGSHSAATRNCPGPGKRLAQRVSSPFLHPGSSISRHFTDQAI